MRKYHGFWLGLLLVVLAKQTVFAQADSCKEQNKAALERGICEFFGLDMLFSIGGDFGIAVSYTSKNGKYAVKLANLQTAKRKFNDSMLYGLARHMEHFAAAQGCKAQQSGRFTVASLKKMYIWEVERPGPWLDEYPADSLQAIVVKKIIEYISLHPAEAEKLANLRKIDIAVFPSIVQVRKLGYDDYNFPGYKRSYVNRDAMDSTWSGLASWLEQNLLLPYYVPTEGCGYGCIIEDKAAYDKWLAEDRKTHNSTWCRLNRYGQPVYYMIPVRLCQE